MTKYYAKEDIVSYKGTVYAKKGDELLMVNEYVEPLAVKTLKGDMFYCNKDLVTTKKP